MKGMNRQTGRYVTGTERLWQSIWDILTTPVGSRVMRRDYGSRLFELVDAPMTSATIMQIYAATAAAIQRWEPEFVLERVSVVSVTDGAWTLSLVGSYVPTGETVTLEGFRIAT